MSEKRVFVTPLIISALAVMAIVAGTTIWMSVGARTTSDRAVAQVSEFYLQELAGRRAQIVSSSIETQFEQMRRAISLMDERHLASQDTLRSYIGEVEDLYDLDLFAVVDEEDVVYTRYATYMGGSRYGFLSDGSLDKGTAINLATVYGGNKQACLAIPVTGHTLMGKELKACFVQIDIDGIVSTLAFDDKGASTLFGLYHRSGDNLTTLDFGPMSASQNLLDGMRHNLSQGDWESLKSDFTEGREGGVDFSSGSTKATLYYSPIPNSSWMLTVLIYDNLIQDQITGLSDEMMARSTIQILVTALALLAFFGVLLMRMRKVSVAMLEIERQNTRNAGERAQKSERELGAVKKLVYVDSLTGIGNKQAFIEEEASCEKKIQEGGLQDVAVAVCDLNELKRINDTLGHQEGDDYICRAAVLLRKTFAQSGVYRIGGDEFAIIVQGEDFFRRQQILEELNRIVEQNLSNNEVVISVGMSDYREDESGLQEAFDRADQLMYERKRQLKQLGARTRD